jgi:hypothetical protein
MDSSEMSTLPLPTSPGATTVDLSRRPAAPRGGGVRRELSGALSVGLAVLALVVLVFQLIAWGRGVPGPGAVMVLGHVALAAVAVAAQRVADRRTGWPATAAVLGVVVVTGTALWLFWWA